MKKRIFFSALVGPLFLHLILSTFLFADVEAELKSVKNRISQVNSRLSQLKSKKKPLLEELYRVELEIKKEDLTLQQTDLELNRLQQNIKINLQHQHTLQNKIAASRLKVRSVVRIMYKMGGHSQLKLFLRVSNINQLFRNYHFFTRLIEIQLKEINQVKENTTKMRFLHKKLNLDQKNLKQKQTLHKKMRQKALDLKKSKTVLVKRFTRDEKINRRLLRELQERARNLNRLIRKSARSVKHIGDGKNAPFTKGSMPWPLSGKIISSFGKKRSTRFNTYILNNGIEIRPKKSDRVRAVCSGTIVFSDYYLGYGNLIIIQHNKNFHSLYGHCRMFLKKKGNKVKAGDIIAVAGESGSTLGKSLYFEIRHNLKPQNPTYWLKSR